MAHKPVKVRVLIVNPDAEIINTPDGVWIISALNVEEMKRHIEENIFQETEKLLQQLIKIAEETIIIKVNVEEGAAKSIFTYKSVISKYDIFYLDTTKGEFIITDHFKNALSSLDMEDRKVTPINIADHLLFPTMPSESTHVSNIYRLGSGEIAVFDFRSGKHTRKVIEKIAGYGQQLTVEQAINKVDETLRRIIGNLKNKKGLVNLLSGGIDSTLVHTYLDSSVPSMSVAIDSPEFTEEVKYARRASSLLNSDHKLITIRETDYLHYLESDIQTLGQPVSLNQLSLIGAAISTFQHNYKTFLSGDFVTGHFGTEETDLQKMTRIKTEDLGAYAKTLYITSDQPCLRQILGNKMVDNRLQSRLDYALRRVELIAESPADQFAELKAMFGFLFNNASCLWRQLAYARGKMVYAPFTGKSLLDISLSIPIENRYTKDQQKKYILKTLLKQKLPEYPVDIRKLGTGLPRTRYCLEGPFKEYFKDHPVPDFIDTRFHDLIKNPRWDTSWMIFNLITYTIWQEQILKNPTLCLVPGTQCFEWKNNQGEVR